MTGCVETCLIRVLHKLIKQTTATELLYDYGKTPCILYGHLKVKTIDPKLASVSSRIVSQLFSVGEQCIFLEVCVYVRTCKSGVEREEGWIYLGNDNPATHQRIRLMIVSGGPVA